MTQRNENNLISTKLGTPYYLLYYYMSSEFRTFQMSNFVVKAN